MFESFAQLFPADWQGAVLTLLAPMRWLAAWQSTIALAWANGSSSGRALAWIALLMPALLIAAGMWCTVASIYTLPFRSGRGAFITSMLMAWWDAGRCIWLFWTGMLRVGVALTGLAGKEEHQPDLFDKPKNAKLVQKNNILRVYQVLERPKQMRLDGGKDDEIVTERPRRKFLKDD